MRSRPDPTNRERFLVAALRTLAAERGLTCEAFCHDWVLRLAQGERVSHVVGYHFELGGATAPLLATDKAATSALLAHAGLPHVEHHLLLHPREASYVGSAGNWQAALAWAEARGFRVVVKPNDGTGGRDVVRTSSVLELEAAVHRLFEKHRALALSPWLEIESEFRAVMLAGEPLLVYSKHRPAVVGDGASTAAALLLEQLGPAALAASELAAGELARIPAAGERVLLSWRHNLGGGALPRELDSAERGALIVSLARNALAALKIELASIDLVEVAGELAVLEVNSGIMLENYVRKAPDGAARAKAIYAAILDHIFSRAG